jgi:hypothetical protein
MTGTLHEDQYTFGISYTLPLRMINDSDKYWRILTNKEIYAIVKKPTTNRDSKAT